MTLLTILHATPTKELLRAYNSQKEYLFFDISVFNVGASIFIICTNTYKEINYGSWNGYNQMHENDHFIKDFIKNVLIERVNEPKEDHPKTTAQQIKRINKIINSINVTFEEVK